MGATAEQTALADDLKLTPESFLQPISGKASDALWQYQKKHTVFGVDVQQQSRKLPFSSQQQMLQALQIQNNVKVWTGYIAPQLQEQNQQYRAIKQKIADGTAIMVSQDRQFVPDKKAFLCFLVYNQLEYKLNQRYDFYKQEIKNG